MQIRAKMKTIAKADGIVDSVRYLTGDFTKENKILLNMIYLQMYNNANGISMFYSVLYPCMIEYVSPILEVCK